MTPKADYVSHIPVEIVERYADWTECAAFRIILNEAGEPEFQVTNDLERITDPEGEDG